MFQCPNCRAYTDLSAEVDDTNDYEAESTDKQAPEDQQEPAEEIRSATCSPQLDTSCTSSGSHTSEEGVAPELPTSTLSDNVENMHLTDNNPSEVPEASITSAPSTGSDVPGWQSLARVPTAVPPRQAILRVDTPVRSESSDENPLTPRNDSGPLAFDGRAGMSSTDAH